MKINGFSHIRKWLLLYLAMVLLTTMVLYLSIFVEITSALTAVNMSGVAQATAGSERTAPLPIAGLKLRLLLILTGGFIICLLLGFVWAGFCTRRIGRPVRIIATAMSKLTRGQLNETVTVGTSDEFEQIGASINELAAKIARPCGWGVSGRRGRCGACPMRASRCAPRLPGRPDPLP